MLLVVSLVILQVVWTASLKLQLGQRIPEATSSKFGCSESLIGGRPMCTLEDSVFTAASMLLLIDQRPMPQHGRISGLRDSMSIVHTRQWSTLLVSGSSACREG
jgi:hypothetical protein